MKVVVIDLDGTLADHSARTHHLASRDWEAYHAGIPDDPVHEDVADFIISTQGEFDFIIVTARPSAYSGETINWLSRNGLAPYFEAVLMRALDDYRSDGVIKPELLRAWLAENGRDDDDVAFILDDRDSAVEGWRNAGFNCWQVRHGGC